MSNKLTVSKLIESVTGMRSDRPIYTILGLAGALVINDLVTTSQNITIGKIGLSTLCCVLILLAMLWVTISNIRAKRRKPEATLSFQLALEPPPQKGIRGLILLVSPFLSSNNQLRADQTKFDGLMMQALSDNNNSLDIFESNQKLDIYNSNLAPNIAALEYHMSGGELREIWLITSESEKINKSGDIIIRNGSYETGLMLKRYFNIKYPNIIVQCEGYSVKLNHYSELWGKIDKIFSNSGYRQEAIIADITGGTKMMTMATAMGCIDDRRRMQYMDSDRDWQGQPITGKRPQPILIDIDPILEIRSAD